MLSPQAILRQGVMLLLIAGIAINLASMTHRLLGGASQSISGVVDFELPKEEAGAGDVSLSSARNAHLFGAAESKPALVKPKAPVVTAPETRLNLKLTGIMAGGSDDPAVAIISSGNGPELPYRIADEVEGTGGATIDAINADHVVLMRNGRPETLRLPKQDSVAQQSARMPPQNHNRGRSGRSGGFGGQVASKLGDFRSRVLSNPSALFSEVQVKPVMENGKIKGYELNSPRNEALLRQAGLQRGDVITHFNGTPLNNPASMSSVFEQLKTADDFDITVERNGASQQLSIALD